MIDEKLISKYIRESIQQIIENDIEEDRTELPNGKVEIDNFSEIYKLLNFKTNNDNIYFVQIIKRDKDNPGQKSRYNAAQYLKEYYFEGLDDFKNAEQEIKNVCDKENARAYIYMNPRSKKVIDQWTDINAKRFRKYPEMGRKFNWNAKALAAGRSFDDPSRPLCFVDVDSDDQNDIDMVLQIIKYKGLTPLYTYRSLNNGIHIILPDVQQAKELKFDIINGDLSKADKRTKMNAKVSLEIDKPVLLYACLSPQGYSAQQARFNRMVNNNKI